MILNKSQLVSNINSEIADQSYGQISPYDIRHNLLDIIDSAHNLTSGNNLNALNFSTLASGNTQVGQSSLQDFRSIQNSNGSNNTAVGYYSLRSNYQSSNNTAVGSQALSCNVFGEGNVALGYNALAGNTVGHLNIGIGNYSLNNNKSGNGNIAIGHGAGYYVNKNTSNKLFIAYHPIDEQHICDNPTGSGWMPLIYGDLTQLKLGIGTQNLTSHGMLHVGGTILPSGSDISSLGHNLYYWKNLYLSKAIEFSNSSSIFTSGTTSLCANANLYPSITNQHCFGSQNYVWLSGYFKDITVLGTATINSLNYIETDTYSGKTFYLGVNGSNEATYSDSSLDGGGLVLKSTTLSKEYIISFRPPSEGMPCFGGDYNAVWYSNINFQVPSDRYIKTNSIVSYDSNSFDDNDCYGLFFNSGITYVSRKNVLNQNPGLPNGHIAGISNINFLSNSGEINDYCLSLSSLESGVSVSQKFLTGTKIRTKDNITQKDNLSGFEIKYIDNLGDTNLNDRLVIGSYNNTPTFVNGLVLMKESTDGAVLSITNISETTENVLPNTIFNVRSKNDCVARFTTENNGFFKSAIQLVGSNNCLSSGLEISYLNNSGIADISIFKNQSGINAIRITDSGRMGIFSSGITNETITIGHSGMQNLPVISLKDTFGVANTNVVLSSGYGKIYNVRNNKIYSQQYNDLVFMDTSGNKFDLVVNKNDSIDGRAVFTNSSGNTFAGYESPSGRLNINGAFIDNTSYGYRSLYQFRSGSGNISIGSNALHTLSSGNNNIVIGRNSGSGLLNSNNNIIIGNSSFIKNPELINTSGNIIIGHDGVGNSVSGSYNFVIGSKENIILLEGKLGPTNNDKMLVLPSGGRLYCHNNDNTESLGIKSNVFEIIDSGGSNYPDQNFIFRFVGNNSSDLLVMNHAANPLTNSENYAGSSRPYIKLNGDLRIKGQIRFSDGTSLDTSSGIANATLLGNSGIALANSGIQKIDSAFIEGFITNGIIAPSTGQKSSGLMITKNSSWGDSASVFVTNRDSTSVIHSGAYVIAAKVNGEYRPIWISAENTSCSCC